MLLTNMLGSLLREQALDERIWWNQLRAEMQMPYPLDHETAAAVEAAMQHYVLTWKVFEESDDIGEWLRESLVADGAYQMKNGTEATYMKVPTEEEVQDLFQGAESYQKFLDGEDYSYGMADVADDEYNAHYEAIAEAVKRVAQEGVVVDLPTVPHQFLSEAPLVDGDWIDLYTVELAEWGARIVEKGFFLEESQDNHSLAWHRIIDPTDGLDIDVVVTEKLWFPGRTKEIDGRTYVRFEDYFKWRGRRNKGNLESGKNAGLVVPQWNQWVQEHGGEDGATMSGVKPAKLNCYIESNQYRLCSDSAELAKEASQRQSSIVSLGVGKPNLDVEKGFRKRAEQWRELAQRVVSEIFALREANQSINDVYFEGQGILFPSLAEGFLQLLNLMEKTVGIYNEDLAGSIERLEGLLNEPGDGLDTTLLAIDLAGLVENVQGVAENQVAYMVDMAKADALDLLGETRQAFEMVDRHV